MGRARRNSESDEKFASAGPDAEMRLKSVFSHVNLAALSRLARMIAEGTAPRVPVDPLLVQKVHSRQLQRVEPSIEFTLL